MDDMIVVWAVLIAVFLVAEGATAGLTSIWFALGAIAALISAFFDAPMWLQIALFIVVSVATLVLTRPLAKKYVNTKAQPTNADMVIGKTATVIESIDNVTGKGTVSVGGRIWTARSETGEPIEKDAITVIKSIEGVKLIVQPQTVKEFAENTKA